MDGCLSKGWDNEMSNITLKGIIDEDFVNYKLPSMTLIFPRCSFKCNKEAGRKVCHNTSLAKKNDIEVDIYKLCERYVKNPITKAVCCQGLEPMASLRELRDFIMVLRLVYKCYDDVVIYTGLNKDEVDPDELYYLSLYPNIIIKYGRYVPDQEPHFDEVLGVNLASDNQYAERISR